MHSKPRGVVAAGNPYTAAAAREILDAGGNAVDAAIAGAFATFVTEPMLTDIGGGGYMLVDRGASGAVYDFFVAVPGLGRSSAPTKLDFLPISLDFGDTSQVFHVGMGAAAVPGNPHGLCTAHAAEGRIPLREVVAPAVRMGRAGVPITPMMAAILKVIRPIFERDPVLKAAVCPGGVPLAAGETLRFSQTADLIEALAQEGPRLFYEGEVAQRLVALCEERGGQITQRDLAQYKTAVRNPLESHIGGARVWLNSPPSTGGALVALGLDLAREVGVPLPLDSEAGAVALAALFVTVQEARQEVLDQAVLSGGYHEHHLGDDAHFDGYCARLRERLEAAPPPGPTKPQERGCTTHVSVVDGDGLAAAITTSNGEGCGVTVAGYGVHLNNMLGEEDLNPGGFHLHAPGSRLPSMMCPTTLRLPDGSVTAVGSGGANRLRTAILQVALRLLVGGQSVEEAVRAPRLHFENDKIDIEPGFPHAVYEGLERRGYKLHRFRELNLYFGGAHVAQRTASGELRAMGDPRRGGSTA
jgi:gamma-glutamyltranspeptidase/glutathione hydrolase